MSNINKQALTDESARESGNILLIVAARMARGELFTPLRYVSELPQKAVGMRTFRDALERSEETLLGEVNKIVDGHGRMAKKLRETEEKLEAAEKRVAELSASHGKLREAMAGIHNTIRGGGAYTPLAAILNASKRAYEESAAAAGKGEAS